VDFMSNFLAILDKNRGKDGYVENKDIKDRCLMIACQYNQADIAAVLEKHGARVDARRNGGGPTPIEIAVSHQSLAVLKRFYVGDVLKVDVQLLERAVAYDDVFKLLLDRFLRDNSNAKDPYLYSTNVLCWSIRNPSFLFSLSKEQEIPLYKYILLNAADTKAIVEEEDHVGCTPMEYAITGAFADSERANIIRLLCKGGASIISGNNVDRNRTHGRSPLHLAVWGSTSIGKWMGGGDRSQPP
jgi:hypothetical protein